MRQAQRRGPWPGVRRAAFFLSGVVLDAPAHVPVMEGGLHFAALQVAGKPPAPCYPVRYPVHKVFPADLPAVAARSMWVYDREAYKRKRPVKTIDRSEIIRGSFSYTTTLSGTFTGGDFCYTDPDKDCGPPFPASIPQATGHPRRSA